MVKKKKKQKKRRLIVISFCNKLKVNREFTYYGRTIGIATLRALTIAFLLSNSWGKEINSISESDRIGAGFMAMKRYMLRAIGAIPVHEC